MLMLAMRRIARRGRSEIFGRKERVGILADRGVVEYKTERTDEEEAT